MRALVLLIALPLASCHGGSRSSDSERANRVARMDSATANRICASPDSVLAGTKECVLRDQGRPADRPAKFEPPPKPQ